MSNPGAPREEASKEQKAVPITSEPRHGQLIVHNGKNYTTIKEGLAYILAPAESRPSAASKSEKSQDAPPQSVFYNPIQQFNRDLSVLAIKVFGQERLPLKKKSRSENKDRRAKKSKKRKRQDVEGGQSLKNGSIEESDSPQEPDPPTEESATLEDQHEDGNNQESHPEGATDKAEQERTPTQFRILDALSATGLRALRYAHEIPFATSITANDLSQEATRAIKLNVQHNKLEDRIQTKTMNALAYMYSGVGMPPGQGVPFKYDVIDLDPYGTAGPFLDAAVQAVGDGGLLCVTCTDSGVFASVGYPEKTYALYGGTPIKGFHSHEGGLRLILHAIASSAARYGLAMEPLLSLSIDFYARVFVKIRRSPQEVKFLAGKTMLVYGCSSGCGAWTTQLLGRNHEHVGKKGGKTIKHSLAQAPSAPQNCEHCGTRTHLGGPMYAGPIHSAPFIRRLLEELATLSPETYGTKPRMEGMLSTALEELSVSDPSPPPDPSTTNPTNPSLQTYNPGELDHHPFYFSYHSISKILHCITPNESAIRGALLHLGYRVTRTHAAPGCIKTDAPWRVIWQVMREWIRQRAPVKEGTLKPTNVGWKILHPEEVRKSAENRSPSREKKVGEAGGVEVEVVFDEELGARKDIGKKLMRYQPNPRPNWGPMNRARSSGKETSPKEAANSAAAAAAATAEAQKPEGEGDTKMGEDGGDKMDVDVEVADGQGGAVGGP
ncbi:MAG: RNA methyltransferase tRNA(m5U54)methyltransferase [Chaenotheca gracillima]|nr:MAG: RNA methyltransferase tRNA(m5U54)methyltransferase [Chaenotheca gracillima]